MYIICEFLDWYVSMDSLPVELPGKHKNYTEAESSLPKVKT